MIIDPSKIQRNVPIPLYYQLKQHILSEITSGNYPPDSMIPTEMEISTGLSISRTTVRQAISELVQEGWLYRIKSKGTFVSRPKVNQDFIQKLEPFHIQILRSGRIPSTQLLAFEVQDAGDMVSHELHLPLGSKVIYMKRRRLADQEPLVTIETYVPYSSCRFLLDHDMEKESLYDVLSQNSDTAICSIRRLVEAVEANKDDARLLGLRVGKPIQHFTSIGYNQFGQPVEYSLARYRGDRNSFEVLIAPEQAPAR